MAAQPPNYGTIPTPGDAHLSQGYGAQDFASPDHQPVSSPMSQTMNNRASSYGDEYDIGNRNSMISSTTAEGSGGVNRAVSSASTAVGGAGAGLPIRNSTLKKRSSMRRASSLKRSSSKRSLKAAGSLAGFGGGAPDSNQEYNSFAYTPVPTSGAPTEVLANRFQSWRQLLKSLITYFREIQASYDTRQKAILKVQNTVANIVHPSVFMSEHGLGEATRILDEYHRKSVAEANKSRDIEADVIGALTGLRNDLGQKIKEIKSLSGDFKNSVEKEQDSTRKAVEQYQDALSRADHDDGSAMGKNDPFVVRLGVDRMIEKQIDEENYLHRAYLNLESSGRELESIVVGEIQKAFNALASILKREGDDAYNTVELLRTGPISIPKDAEWMQFVTKDEHFVDPSMPLRRIEDIYYPGKDNPAAAEVRAGMLERKSKYLKSYTPGWYVLSPTHLHEFKSADKIFSQPPVMSLYLPDQKLGSRSQEDSSSHKFMLKGKQSGGMHKGHNWVFRAESYDTMVAWYEDIKVLTEATGEQRNNFVRKHARSVSGGQHSDKATISSDGLEEDEADAVPYSADATSLSAQNALSPTRPARPQPGGRFPSDLRVPQNRDLRSPSSENSDDDGTAGADAAAATAAAGGVAGGALLAVPRDESPRRDSYGGQDPYRLTGVSTGNHTRNVSGVTDSTADDGSYYAAGRAAQSGADGDEGLYAATAAQAPTFRPMPQRTQQPTFLPTTTVDQQHQQQPIPEYQTYSTFANDNPAIHMPDGNVQQQVQSNDWIAPAALAGAAGAAGLGGAAAYGLSQHQDHDQAERATEPFPSLETEDQPLGATSLQQPQQQETRGLDGVIEPAPAPGITAPAGGADAGTLAGNTALSGADAKGLEELGGNERLGAHETGTIPTVIRHQSTMSVSMLHVPGEFPKRG